MKILMDLMELCTLPLSFLLYFFNAYVAVYELHSNNVLFR